MVRSWAVLIAVDGGDEGLGKFVDDGVLQFVGFAFQPGHAFQAGLGVLFGIDDGDQELRHFLHNAVLSFKILKIRSRTGQQSGEHSPSL